MVDNMTPITTDMVLEKLSALPIASTIAKAQQAGPVRQKTLSETVQAGDYDGAKAMVQKDMADNDALMARNIRHNDVGRVNTALAKLRGAR